MKTSLSSLLQNLLAGRRSERSSPSAQTQKSDESDPLDAVLTYHHLTKHNYYRYAAGPGYLDWDSQPNPFRRYETAPLHALPQIPAGDRPGYEAACLAGQVSPTPLNRDSLSQLFFDSLALSAWKE
jgi:hypothetical protein